MPFVFEACASIQPPQALMLQGITLPAALMGQPYAQSMASQASGGLAPLAFNQLAASGPGTYSTNSAGVVTGTPTVSNVQVTDTGVYILTETGDVQVT